MELYIGVHYQSDWYLDRYRNQDVRRNGPAGLSLAKKPFQSDWHLESNHHHRDDKSNSLHSRAIKHGVKSALDRLNGHRYENTINVDDVLFVDRELEMNQMNNANSPNMRNFSPPTKLNRDKMTAYDSDADNWQVSLFNKVYVRLPVSYYN